MNTFLALFPKHKPIIGMVHLGHLVGSQFNGIDSIVSSALADICALESGGIDGLIIENWHEEHKGAFTTKETRDRMTNVAKKLAPHIHIPFGVNVLNNDYEAAFDIAKTIGAHFVQLDVFVDDVRSDYVYNKDAQNDPFYIKVDPNDVRQYATSISADHLPLIVFVQPKHYQLLDPDKPLEQSVAEAETQGASGVIVTKATGVVPSIDYVKHAVSAKMHVAVGVGSGITEQSIQEYLRIADFAIIGTALKIDGNIDNPVDEQRVKRMMQKTELVRRHK